MKILELLIVLILFFIEIISQEIISFKTSDGESLINTKIGKGPNVIFLCGGPGTGKVLCNLMQDQDCCHFK